MTYVNKYSGFKYKYKNKYYMSVIYTIYVINYFKSNIKTSYTAIDSAYHCLLYLPYFIYGWGCANRTFY